MRYETQEYIFEESVRLCVPLFAMIFKISSAQTTEIKLDIFDILALLALDVTLEQNLNTESSIGISALFNFAKSYTETIRTYNLV